MIATLANSAWLASCLPEYFRFRHALGQVRAEQERVLGGILRRNQASAFGRRFGFSAIRTPRDYQTRVPLSVALFPENHIDPWPGCKPSMQQVRRSLAGREVPPPRAAS